MPARRLARMLRDLSGRTDQALAALVVEQLTTAAAGVALAREVTDGTRDPRAARAEMSIVEHLGDAHRAQLIGRLQRSVTSPIDREDLFRLSRCVDDVLDALRDFVRETDLFRAAATEYYGDVLAALAAGIEHLSEAVRLLPTRPRQAADRALLAKKSGVRPAYQLAMSTLLNEPLSSEVMKAVLLLGRLDLAGERLAAAADALADGVVKRFQ